MVNPFVWISGFSDPNDLDFKGQKGKWEEAFNKKLSTFSALSEFLYGGVTILSMKQDEFSDTSIHVETEIVFGVEVAIFITIHLYSLSKIVQANGTDIKDALDRVNFGGTVGHNFLVDQVLDIFVSVHKQCEHGSLLQS